MLPAPTPAGIQGMPAGDTSQRLSLTIQCACAAGSQDRGTPGRCRPGGRLPEEHGSPRPWPPPTVFSRRIGYLQSCISRPSIVWRTRSSLFIRKERVLQACNTVPWSRPPKVSPICCKDALVCRRVRYIATRAREHNFRSAPLARSFGFSFVRPSAGRLLALSASFLNPPLRR